MMSPWLLNADVGEGYDDSRLMAYLDCASICCGAHAGGVNAMRSTLALAKRHGVTPGAHPGYGERATFGRRSLSLPLAELEASVREQILTLTALAAETALKPAYVKPHGAMNHDMLEDDTVFAAICRAVASLDPTLAVMVPTNPRQRQQRWIARENGLTIWWEVFADRAYEPSGLLRSRDCRDAVHSTPERIVAQLEGIVRNGKIRAVDGSDLEVGEASTICVHGDHPVSVEAIRRWTRIRG